MALAELRPCPDVVSIIPNTGIQFLDFGFTVSGAGRSAPSRVPTDWGFNDPKASSRTAALPLPILLRRGDEEITPGRDSYTVDIKRLTKFAHRRWLPLPLLREEPGARYFHGPTNWARVYLVHLPERDLAGNDYRLVLAIDTALMAFHEDGAYLAPSPDDARNGRHFSLPSVGEYTNYFLQQPWVRDWLDECFKDMLEEQEPRRKKLTPEEIAERKEGPNEPAALYTGLIDLIYHLDIIATLTLTDTVTAAKQEYVDVDMVIDLGNSRTCGLLVEAEPGYAGADINRAFKLELRDLSQPEHVYGDPFDSRLEFALARFGLDHHSHRSGRTDAFAWPTITRVGPEAVRLAGNRRGSEGRTGMSSPKRYLWDEDVSRQSWRFNGPSLDGEWEGYAAQGVFAGLINDAGKPLHMVVGEEDDLPTLLARYSRSNLVSFALAEVLLQAIVMMNAPASRFRRTNADLPRRLRRLILTMPTALSLAERQILWERAVAARDLVYICLGQARRRQEADGTGELDWIDGSEPPEIVIKWDEASATQVVYLYSEIALAFSGDARAFIRSVRGSSRDGAGETNRLRAATLDIGGGTTDLVITRLDVEGQGANVTIFPTQLFRESLSLAGDDIVRALARRVIVGAFTRAIGTMLSRDRAEALEQQLFGANLSGMTVEEQLRRQQFAIQVAAPAVISILSEYENFDPLRPPTAQERTLASLLPAGARIPESIVKGIEQAVRNAGGGADFKLLDLPVAIDMLDIDKEIRNVVGDTLRALAEIAWRYGADLLLLSGRPSRFPAIRNVILESGALPAHRVVAMHDFRTGPWYPFRDQEARISDPKTTAAVGGMLCLLAEGHLQNFNFRSDRLQAKSVARYLGKIEDHNRLLEQDVYYADLDLETDDYELPESSFDFRGPILLGVRQFPNDWWPASLLYTIDYADEEQSRKLRQEALLRVQLRRERRVRFGRSSDGRPATVNDRLEIARIERANGNVINRNSLKMRLQTLPRRDGYWLDTGILVDI
ncbi:MAG: virulence factor SrfB [Alphaproteobacteria bacterium]